MGRRRWPAGRLEHVQGLASLSHNFNDRSWDSGDGAAAYRVSVREMLRLIVVAIAAIVAART
jgi:hypothetical protein